MTTVRIKHGQSSVHGIGCFAIEQIEPGDLVWRFDPDFDVVFKAAFVRSLSDAARENVLTYAFVSKTTGDYILCSDDSRFMNHSDEPNIRCVIPKGSDGNELDCYALKSIHPGEEITCDYSDFDAESVTTP